MRIARLSLPWLLFSSVALGQDAAPKPASRPATTETDEEAVALADRIEKEVEKVRGLTFKHPVKKGIYDRERLAKFLQEQSKKEKADEQMAWQGRAWKLLGLIPADYDLEKEMTEVLLEQIGGFYDPESKELRVMRGFGGLMGEVLMAHELCHALEDQNFDLKSIDDGLKVVAPDDDDRVFAAHAVMEGSATDLMTRYMTNQLMNGSVKMEDALAADLDNPAMRGEKAMAAPPIVVRPLMEMYMSGATFLARGGMLPGTAKKKDVNRAFRDLPLSSEQVLHPEKYWDKEKRDDPQSITLPDLSKDLGEGWKRAGRNVLGEIGISILTLPKPEQEEVAADASPMEKAKAAAASMFGGEKSSLESRGWDGDRYELYRGPNDASVLVWVSVWDTENDVNELAAWLAKERPKATGVADGTRFAVVSGLSDRARARDIAQSALKDAKVEPAKPLAAPKPAEPPASSPAR